MSKAEELSESLCRMDTFTGFQRIEILKAAAELRRLQAENDALMSALVGLHLATKDVSIGHYNEEAHDIAVSAASAVLKGKP